MKLLLDFDPGKCSACGACAVACMDQNDIDVEGGQHPYRKVHSYERGGRLLNVSISCLHCPDAPCVPSCPVGCLSKDPDTGLTRLDNTNCIGCRACAMACPHGAPTFRPVELNGKPREKMEKCHGCIARVEAGLVPACVHSCPTGALSWRWAEDGETASPAKLCLSQHIAGPD